MDLSDKALALLAQLMGPQSNLQIPAGVAAEVVEIRQWVERQQQARAKAGEDGA